jgi:hypothetical protein
MFTTWISTRKRTTIYDPLEKSEEIGGDGEQGKREATKALSQATPPKPPGVRFTNEWITN